MKRWMMILAVLTMVLGLSSVLFGQNRTKAKAKAKAKVTKPASNTNYVGETEKNLSKTKNVNKTESSVFEPNDANTWIKDNPKESAGTPAPNKTDGKIMDIVDMAKQPESQNSTQTNNNPKQKGVAQVGLNKKPQNLTEGTVIVSSKTAKPKRKPAKSTASKRKPN